MSIAASELKTRYHGLVAPGNDSAFYALLNEADERLLMSGRWHWARTPMTLAVDADNQVVLPAGYKAIVGARINGHGVGVNWEESAWFEGGPGETIPIEGAKTFLVDLGLVANTDSTYATATLDPDGSNNEVVVTAVEAGSVGNNITVEIAAPSGGLTTVATAGSNIVVTPALPATMSVGGTTTTDGSTPTVWSGSLLYAGLYNGKPAYTGGGDLAEIATPGFDSIYWDNSWSVYHGASGLYWSHANNTDAYPDLSEYNLPAGPNTGTAIVTAGGAVTASDVVSALNGDVAASALIVASLADGWSGSGAVSAVPQTYLSGGLTRTARTYRLSRISDDITEIEVLARYEPSVIDGVNDFTRCPHHGALKLMMMAIVYENASEESKAENYRAMAQRELDKHEAAYRGIAKRIYKPSLTQPLPRRSRTGFP